MNLLMKVRKLPVHPWLRVEALGAAERKPQRCRYIEEQKQSCQVEHVASSRVGCHITPSNAAKRESALQHEQVHRESARPHPGWKRDLRRAVEHRDGGNPSHTREKDCDP